MEWSYEYTHAAIWITYVVVMLYSDKIMDWFHNRKRETEEQNYYAGSSSQKRHKQRNG